MSVAFLTPLGALVGLGLAAPVAAALLRDRREGRLRRVLGLAAPGRLARSATALAAVVLLALLAAAAAQPVVRLPHTLELRKDAQVYLVLDVSGSMAASASAGAPTRFERARALALRLRAALADVPVGLATISDRILPHVLPTPDERVFAAAAERAIGVGRPPPTGGVAGRVVSELASLPMLGSGYFARVPHRLAIVLTDAESNDYIATEVMGKLRRQRIGVLLVRVRGPHDSIYRDGRRDPGFVPFDGTEGRLAALAPLLVGGRVYSERELAAVAAAAKATLGTGPTASRGREDREVRLGRWLALAAVAPLLLLLLARDSRVRLRPGREPA